MKIRTGKLMGHIFTIFEQIENVHQSSITFAVFAMFSKCSNLDKFITMCLKLSKFDLPKLTKFVKFCKFVKFRTCVKVSSMCSNLDMYKQKSELIKTEYGGRRFEKIVIEKRTHTHIHTYTDTGIRT